MAAGKDHLCLAPTNIARDVLTHLRAGTRSTSLSVVDALLAEAADVIEDLLARVDRIQASTIATATIDLLRRLAHLTIQEFAHGGEKVEREALYVALGLDPDESLEPLDTPPFGLPRERAPRGPACDACPGSPECRQPVPAVLARHWTDGVGDAVSLFHAGTLFGRPVWACNGDCTCLYIIDDTTVLDRYTMGVCECPCHEVPVGDMLGETDDDVADEAEQADLGHSARLALDTYMGYEHEDER